MTYLPDHNSETLKIAILNDACRQYVMMPISGKPEVPCQIYMTRGVMSLSPEDQIIIAAKVRDYNDFTEDNDPHGEHDFGAFNHNGQKIFWKIDYYDQDVKYGSDDPADVACTTRVLTIMLAEDY